MKDFLIDNDGWIPAMFGVASAVTFGWIMFAKDPEPIGPRLGGVCRQACSPMDSRMADDQCECQRLNTDWGKPNQTARCARR